MTDASFYIFREPIATPAECGIGEPVYERLERDGMLIERNVRIPMRDGIELYADLYRPPDERLAPPLIGWTPFGKHDPIDPERYANAGLDPAHMSAYTAFEAPDPVYWIRHGYAVLVVDVRGLWQSPGRATYASPEQACDLYDAIEWAGTQPWSNGKVGLSGVSYLTVMQWRVAELAPPHLAAINPWEGWTDIYREVAHHGGIPESWFWPQLLPQRWCVGTEAVEDLPAEARAHPLFDAYWESKRAKLERIRTPAYVVASWCDHGLHTRGTLEGFKRIASRDKWLDVHASKKWAHYYEPANVERARAFFDHYLKDLDTGLDDWPRVRMVVRAGNGKDRQVAEKEWPIARTSYEKLHLDLDSAALVDSQPAAASSASYNPVFQDGRDAECLELSYRFRQDTDLVGHMKLRLWVEADGADDMDIFVGIEKYGTDGARCNFVYYAQFDDGPAALGWLRVSHRELDPQASTEHQPVHLHLREQKLTPGEIVPVDIEIWPSSTRFEVGSELRLVIQGSDIRKYPKRYAVYARHEETVNRGRHIVHAGGRFDSHLLVPVVPET